MGVYPSVNIETTSHRNITQSVSRAGKVAVIGAFKSEVSTLQMFTNLRDAQTSLGDETETSFMGCKCLPHLFRKDSGASAIIVANISTKTGETWNTSITSEKLASALSKLAGENYDILFVADELDDTGLTAVKTALDNAYTDKKPVGLIAPINRANKSAYLTTAQKFATGGTYGLIIQSVYLNDSANALSLTESSAYYCGLVAGLPLDSSMTMKQLPSVTGLGAEYTFGTGEDGLAYVNAGLTVFRTLDRVNKKYVVVNSEQPSGYDLYVERVKDFIIKNLNLEDYLGLQNRSTSLKAIEGRLETLKESYVNTLALLEDIQYEVEKASSNCVNVYIDSLKFAGIITRIDVFLTVEVE